MKAAFLADLEAMRVKFVGLAEAFPPRIDERRVRHWEIVNLAARVLDEVGGERPRLLRRFRKELARGDAS
ncbi:MAG: hypothetical protein DMF89_03085 [Acidobacteria bacterium]|nr:MAG: hypothetical protein DMF90_21915 [Acidobacteriota bacterium]PYR52307.1 MAG: hypothetical protein DMF89_03085 [Acidobacteriota bacterium]